MTDDTKDLDAETDALARRLTSLLEEINPAAGPAMAALVRVAGDLLKAHVPPMQQGHTWSTLSHLMWKEWHHGDFTELQRLQMVTYITDSNTAPQQMRMATALLGGAVVTAVPTREARLELLRKAVKEVRLKIEQYPEGK
jgi:hypothetical protein